MATKKPETRTKAKQTPGKASAAPLKVLNAALETFNDKSAMTFDGPGKWHDWLVDAVESSRGLQVVKLRAGKDKTTVKFAASIALVERGQASQAFVSAVSDRLMDFMDGVEASDDFVVEEDPNAGRLAPQRAPKLTDAQRAAFKLEEARALAERIAALERAETAADEAPTRADFEKALKKDWADDFVSLLERSDGTATRLGIAMLFEKKKTADFVAEAIRPFLQSVQLTRKQWAFVARAQGASSVVVAYATARS
ncbi:MAG: hypothetical protein Q8N23_04565 [Archangium sp.]|nr:hypothetical protein [Archangium sp.]MDP3151916.1 hypothetical protein [Archangium sp.]MDP3571329.1 hypothetical protein [Archangium sp.]